MKILILSSNNGGGHNSAAKALLEEAKSRNVECVMIDAMIPEAEILTLNVLFRCT